MIGSYPGKTIAGLIIKELWEEIPVTPFLF